MVSLREINNLKMYLGRLCHNLFAHNIAYTINNFLQVGHFTVLVLQRNFICFKPADGESAAPRNTWIDFASTSAPEYRPDAKPVLRCTCSARFHQLVLAPLRNEMRRCWISHLTDHIVQNLNGGFVNRVSVSFGFFTSGTSPCKAT